MAVFTILEGAPNPSGPHDGGPNTELGLVQSIVNSQLRLGKKGLSITWVFDNVARTLQATFTGSAA